jgi:uridine phosphorylase
LGKEHTFNTVYPAESITEIIKANTDKGLPIVTGKTIGANDFYIEQNRIDGAIAFCTEQEKMEWLKKAEKLGVKNIEMETPLMAGFLNHWGFKNFAAICCVLVNRLKGDQVKATHNDLERYSLNAEKVLWNYLDSI